MSSRRVRNAPVSNIIGRRKSNGTIAPCSRTSIWTGGDRSVSSEGERHDDLRPTRNQVARGELAREEFRAARDAQARLTQAELTGLLGRARYLTYAGMERNKRFGLPEERRKPR